MTHYDMRYDRRKIADAEAYQIFEEAEYCVISTVDADGMPYGFPISHVLKEGVIYIHTTNTFGHKLDDFMHDPRICATAVGPVAACFEETFFTTRYESAIAFGRIRRVEDAVEAKQALVALCMKYLPEFKHEIGPAIEREMADTAVWAIGIDEVTGKAARKIGDWTPES